MFNLLEGARRITSRYLLQGNLPGKDSHPGYDIFSNERKRISKLRWDVRREDVREERGKLNSEEDSGLGENLVWNSRGSVKNAAVSERSFEAYYLSSLTDATRRAE